MSDRGPTDAPSASARAVTALKYLAAAFIPSVPVAATKPVPFELLSGVCDDALHAPTLHRPSQHSSLPLPPASPAFPTDPIMDEQSRNDVLASAFPAPPCTGATFPASAVSDLDWDRNTLTRARTDLRFTSLASRVSYYTFPPPQLPAAAASCASAPAQTALPPAPAQSPQRASSFSVGSMAAKSSADAPPSLRSALEQNQQQWRLRDALLKEQQQQQHQRQQGQRYFPETLTRVSAGATTLLGADVTVSTADPHRWVAHVALRPQAREPYADAGAEVVLALPPVPSVPATAHAQTHPGPLGLVRRDANRISSSNCGSDSGSGGVWGSVCVSNGSAERALPPVLVGVRASDVSAFGPRLLTCSVHTSVPLTTVTPTAAAASAAAAAAAAVTTGQDADYGAGAGVGAGANAGAGGLSWYQRALVTATTAVPIPWPLSAPLRFAFPSLSSPFAHTPTPAPAPAPAAAMVQPQPPQQQQALESRVFSTATVGITLQSRPLFLLADDVAAASAAALASAAAAAAVTPDADAPGALALALPDLASAASGAHAAAAAAAAAGVPVSHSCASAAGGSRSGVDVLGAGLSAEPDAAAAAAAAALRARAGLAGARAPAAMTGTDKMALDAPVLHITATVPLTRAFDDPSRYLDSGRYRAPGSTAPGTVAAGTSALGESAGVDAASGVPPLVTALARAGASLLGFTPHEPADWTLGARYTRSLAHMHARAHGRERALVDTADTLPAPASTAAAAAAGGATASVSVAAHRRSPCSALHLALLDSGAHVRVAGARTFHPASLATVAPRSQAAAAGGSQAAAAGGDGGWWLDGDGDGDGDRSRGFGGSNGDIFAPTAAPTYMLSTTDASAATAAAAAGGTDNADAGEAAFKTRHSLAAAPGRRLDYSSSAGSPPPHLYHTASVSLSPADVRAAAQRARAALAAHSAAAVAHAAAAAETAGAAAAAAAESMAADGAAPAAPYPAVTVAWEITASLQHTARRWRTEAARAAYFQEQSDLVRRRAAAAEFDRRRATGRCITTDEPGASLDSTNTANVTAPETATLIAPVARAFAFQDHSLSPPHQQQQQQRHRMSSARVATLSSAALRRADRDITQAQQQQQQQQGVMALVPVPTPLTASSSAAALPPLPPPSVHGLRLHTPMGGTHAPAPPSTSESARLQRSVSPVSSDHPVDPHTLMTPVAFRKPARAPVLPPGLSLSTDDAAAAADSETSDAARASGCVTPAVPPFAPLSLSSWRCLWRAMTLDAAHVATGAAGLTVHWSPHALSSVKLDSRGTVSAAAVFRSSDRDAPFTSNSVCAPRAHASANDRAGALNNTPVKVALHAQSNIVHPSPLSVANVAIEITIGDV